MILTIEEIEKNSHISTETIEIDICDTENEINQLEAILDVLMKNSVENQLEIFMKKGDICNRKSFIEKLDCILEYRNKKGERLKWVK